jgi:ATP-binding cassette subfamily B protein
LLRRGAAVLRTELRLHPRPFAVGVAGAMLYAAATVGTSWVIGRVVDRVVRPRFLDGDVSTGAVVVAGLAITFVGVLRATGIVVRRAGATRAKLRIEASLREQVVERFEQLPLAWHQARPTGELLSYTVADVEAATEVLAPLPYATGVVTLLFVATAWMVASDPVLAMVALVLLPALLTVNFLYQRRIEGPAGVEQQAIGRVSAVAHESFDGALVVKALGMEDREAMRFAVAADALCEAKVRVAALRARFDATLDALPALGTIVVLVVGAWRVERGAISEGTLVAFVSLLTLLLLPLRLIGYVLGDLARTVAGWDRVRAVLDEPVPPPTPPQPPKPPLALVADGVTFAYPGDPPVLHDLSLAVEAGRTVAVVGPTGSGKSTLLSVLAGLLPPAAGCVRVAGDVALAFQEAFLFSASIAENILLGRDLDLDEAARVARVDEFVDALPDGYETVVGERGATLSGGQRQRIALARALAGRPHVLLLDDATSSVDPRTEAEILGALPTVLAGATTVMVATRPATIAVADEVLFLDGGRVMARGTHEELLASVPEYAALVRAYQEQAVEQR